MIMNLLQQHPDNLYIAHDTGLKYYQLAAHEEAPAEEVVGYWQRVISCWSLVFDSSSFWKDWAAARSAVYQQSVSEKNIADARKSLQDRLLAEITSFDSRFPQFLPRLEVWYRVEMAGLRLLRSLKQTPTLHGPLLARQLGIGKQIQDLLGSQPYQEASSQERIQAILSPLQEDVSESIPAPSIHQLYSSLGPVALTLELGHTQEAAALLTRGYCQSCHPELTGPDAENRSPAACQFGCAFFQEQNMAYAGLPGGANLFNREATALYARIQVALAEECLAINDREGFVRRLRLAIQAAHGLGIANILRTKLGEILLSKGKAALDEKQYDQAIALFRCAPEFDSSGNHIGRLALALNQRGVTHANQDQWELAEPDLREALQLRPADPKYREDLATGLANQAAKASDPKKREQFQKESELVREGRETQAAPPPPPPPMAEPKPQPARREMPRQANLHPDLFDNQGALNWSMFDPESQAILRAACKLAVEKKEAVIDLPVLVMAMKNGGGSENPPANDIKLSLRPVTNTRLAQAALTQYDFWLSVLDVLLFACELALKEKRPIHKVDLIAGLEASPRSKAWFSSLQVSFEWHKEMR